MNFQLSIKVIVKKYILYTYILSLFKTQILFAGSCKENKQTTKESNSGKSALNSEEIKAQEQFKLLMNNEYKNNSVEVPDYCQFSDNKISLTKNGNYLDVSDTNFINKLSTLINAGKIKDPISNYYYKITSRLCLVEQYKNKKLINRYLLQKNKLNEYEKKLTNEGYKLQNNTKKNDTEEIKIYSLTDFNALNYHRNLDRFYLLLKKYKMYAGDNIGRNEYVIYLIEKELENNYNDNCTNINWFINLIKLIKVYLKIEKKETTYGKYLCNFYNFRWNKAKIKTDLKFFINYLYDYYYNNSSLKAEIDAFLKKTSTEKILYKYIYTTYCQ